jgi:hypothetical protein
MYSNRKVFCSLSIGLILISGPLVAALNFHQEVTLTSFASEETTKDIAGQFLKAAEGDSNLKVVDIRYKQEKLEKDNIAYNAIITCRVSKLDIDVLRIQKKMIQNNDNLKGSNP